MGSFLQQPEAECEIVEARSREWVDPVGVVGRAGGDTKDLMSPRNPMFQNYRTNFFGPGTLLSLSLPISETAGWQQYVTAKIPLRSYLLEETIGNIMRGYIGSLGEAEFNGGFRNTRKNKNGVAADLSARLPIHLYLLHISSTLGDVIGLRHQFSSLDPLRVFFYQTPLS